MHVITISIRIIHTLNRQGNMFYFNIHIDTHRERKDTIFRGETQNLKNLFRFEGDNTGSRLFD
jgi:hypothetical protein